MKKYVKSLVIMLVLILTLVSCVKNETKESDENKVVETTYTDMIGREVKVKTNLKKIVCIGAGALRLYSYVGDMAKLVGAEDIDRNPESNKRVSVRPYQVAYSDLLKNLPSCGVGGPQAQHPEAEKILRCKPDLVVSLMKDPKEINELANKINIPVLVLDYGKTECFDQKLYDSINLLGNVLNRKERANQVVKYLQDIKLELNNKTKDVLDENKPGIYLGCHANWGSKGFFSSTTNYSIFNASNIKNVLDVALGKDKGYVKEVDFEVLLKATKIDKVILDASGINLMKKDYEDQNKANIINSLTPFKTGEVYLQLPYNAYYTNIEVALLDAYYAASLSYSDIFADLNIEQKGKDIFNFLLQKDCYNDYITKLGYNYGKVNLAKEFPNYAK